MLLALHAGVAVVAHHVDHGNRDGSRRDAERARSIAAHLDVGFQLHHAQVAAGPNFEARARSVRHQLVPATAMWGHTLDDRAETMLLRLMRGTGPSGLDVLTPSERHPIARLRRRDTVAISADAGIDVIDDPTNLDPAHLRNRVRHELVPLLDDIASRDVGELLARHADHVADDAALLDALAGEIDPTDCRALTDAHPSLSRRAIRRWLAAANEHRYPPDAAAIDRVLDVVAGHRRACEIGGGVRVERSHQRLRIVITSR